MENSEFIKLAEDTILHISDKIEDSDTDYILDTDLLGGILHIELPEGGQYVINKHDPSKQIWMSSPISGASHFSYDGTHWVDSKGHELHNMLASELKNNAGISVDF